MLSHNARYELHPRESLDQRSGKGKERVGRRIRVLPRGMALMYPAPSVSHPPTLLSDILSSSPRLGLDTSGPGHFTATHESPFHTQAEYSSAQGQHGGAYYSIEAESVPKAPIGGKETDF